MEKIVVLPGRKFGRLTVVREGAGKLRSDRKYRLRTMVCRCDCGSPDKEIRLETLLNGASRSCGCLRREVSAANNFATKRTHGMRKHYLYATWTGERARCGTSGNPGYRSYGGRGITFYEPWQDFPTFVRDVEAEIGPRPGGRLPSGRPEYSLDRRDVEGNYEPGNIRWADWREQALNQRKVHELSRQVVELREQNRRLTAELGAALSELDMLRGGYR